MVRLTRRHDSAIRDLHAAGVVRVRPNLFAPRRHWQDGRRLSDPLELMRRADYAEFQRGDQPAQFIENLRGGVPDQLRVERNPRATNLLLLRSLTQPPKTVQCR